MKRKPQIDESFREDRNWHTTDAPDDSATLREKLEWQRKLEAQRQKAEKPSDLPEVDFDETRWWCIPGAISPEYQRQQMKRQIQRLQRKPRSNTGLTGSRTSDVQGAVSFQIGWGQNGKRLLSIISRARVSELERIVAGKHRPPSRLANVFRYLVSNIDTLEQIVEDWKSREQHKPATPNG